MIAGRTVSYTTHGDGILVEYTWVPAYSWLSVDDVAAAHRVELSHQEPGTEAGAPEINAAGVRCTFTFVDGSTAIARYLTSEDRLVRLTARGDTETTSAMLEEAISQRLDAEAVITLSTLEIRVVEEILGIDPVHFIAGSWWREIDDAHRSLLAEQVKAGLLDRGLLLPAGEHMSDRLRRAVRPILDADLIALATRRDQDSVRMVAVGARGGQWSILAGASPARLEFLPISDAEDAPRRLIAALSVDEATHEAASAPASLRTLWHVLLVRKADAGLEESSVSWCADVEGLLWRIDSPIGGTDRADVTPWSRSAAEAELAGLFGIVNTKEAVR